MAGVYPRVLPAICASTSRCAMRTQTPEMAFAVSVCTSWHLIVESGLDGQQIIRAGPFNFLWLNGVWILSWFVIVRPKQLHLHCSSYLSSSADMLRITMKMSSSIIERQRGERKREREREREREDESKYESALACDHDVLSPFLFRVIAAPEFNIIPSWVAAF